ncbi:MAG: ferric reductase-like transmembrane domain-containing protein [Actinomycetes bacterium]
MIAASSPWLWYSSRASGIVSLVLLTAVMVLGIMTATRVGGRQLPRFAVAEIHRRIGLLTMVFLGIHIGTTVIDTYVPVGFLSIVVPFASPYKQVWVGLGTVAFDLLVAVVVSSLLKARISHGAWRAIHWLSSLAWPIALTHVVFIGTDLRFSWMDLLVAGCIALVLIAAAWRQWAHPRSSGALTAVPTNSLGRRAATRSGPAPSAPPRAPTGRPVASSRRAKRR